MRLRVDPSRNLDRERGRPVVAADIRPYALPLHEKCRRGLDRKTGKVCSCATRRFLRAHPEVIMDAHGNAWWPKKVAAGPVIPVSARDQLGDVLRGLSPEALQGVRDAAREVGVEKLLEEVLPDALREDTLGAGRRRVYEDAMARPEGPATIASGLDACCDLGLAAKVEAIALGKQTWSCPVHAA